MTLPTIAAQKFLTKTISLLVVFSFVFSNLALAEIPKNNPTLDVKKSQEIVTDPDKIVIQRDYGLVKSKFTGKDKRLIIHIQDAHCNFEAQSNIIKVLESLVKNDGLNLVSVEGADGFIDTSWFKAFPDAEIRKEVATYFMKKGEITGPEFLSITTDLPIKLFGAETRSYYIENLNAFTSGYPLKEDTEKYFNQIRAAINKLKNYIYSEELKEFDIKNQDYESKKLSFTDYVRYLELLGNKYKINLRSYDNLFKLVSVLIYEKKIDFNVVDKERAALIDVITKKLDKEQLTELVNKSLEFKVGKIASVEYYAYLKTLAAKYGVSMLTEYPNLFNYIIYNSVYSKIENEQLFNDIKKFEEAVKDKIFSNDDQRILEKLSRHINILIGLVNIKLLNGDFDYYKASKEEFSHEAFAEFIKKMTSKYGFAFEVDSPSDAVRESISKLEDFYAIAIKRDKALVDNTLQAMKKENTQIAVLVTGGFHSEGITKMLERQGVSYIVVCPNITKDVETPYIKILTNQRTPLEEILSDTGATTPDAKNVKSGMLAPYLITAARIHKKAMGELIWGRTEADLSAWTDENVKLWLPKARQAAGERGLTFTRELATVLFGLDVDNSVNKCIENIGDAFSKDQIRQLKKSAGEVKILAEEYIRRALDVTQPDTSVREKTVGAALTDNKIDKVLEDALKDPKRHLVIFNNGKIPENILRDYPQYADLVESFRRILRKLDDKVFAEILRSPHVDNSDGALTKVFTKESLLTVFEPGSLFRIILIQPKEEVPGVRVPGILMTRSGSNYGHYSTKEDHDCVYIPWGLIDSFRGSSWIKAVADMAHETTEYIIFKNLYHGKGSLENLTGIESRAHFAAQLLEREIAGPSPRNRESMLGPHSALDDTLDDITVEYFRLIDRHVGVDRHAMMAKRYMKGEIKVPAYPIKRMLRMTDVGLDLTTLTAGRKRELLEIAIDYFTKARKTGEKISITVMASGEGSRMKAGSHRPEILDQAQRDEPKRFGDPALKEKSLPPAKALNPSAKIDGKWMDFLAFHFTNIKRMNDIFEELGLGRPFVPKVMDNDNYHAAFMAEMKRNNYYGFNLGDILIFPQPLGRRIVASVKDVEAHPEEFMKLGEYVYERALEYARAHEGEVLTSLAGVAEGHGDYFQSQLIPLKQYGGKTMLELSRERNIAYDFVHNIDNMAMVDENWMILFGYMLEQNYAAMMEVSRRPKGSAGKGGGFIITPDFRIMQMEDDVYGASVKAYGFDREADENAHNINGQTPTPTNNGSLFTRINDVFNANYGSIAELENVLNISDAAQKYAKLTELVQEGRKKFGIVPTLKVVNGPEDYPIGTIIFETRAWDIQKGVQDKIGVVGTVSAEDILDRMRSDGIPLVKSSASLVEEINEVRFAPLKEKEHYDEPALQASREALVEKAVKGSLVSDEFMNMVEAINKNSDNLVTPVKSIIAKSGKGIALPVQFSDGRHEWVPGYEGKKIWRIDNHFMIFELHGGEWVAVSGGMPVEVSDAISKDARDSLAMAAADLSRNNIAGAQAILRKVLKSINSEKFPALHAQLYNISTYIGFANDSETLKIYSTMLNEMSTGAMRGIPGNTVSNNENKVRSLAFGFQDGKLVDVTGTATHNVIDKAIARYYSDKPKNEESLHVLGFNSSGHARRGNLYTDGNDISEMVDQFFRRNGLISLRNIFRNLAREGKIKVIDKGASVPIVSIQGIKVFGHASDRGIHISNISIKSRDDHQWVLSNVDMAALVIFEVLRYMAVDNEIVKEYFEIYNEYRADAVKSINKNSYVSNDNNRYADSIMEKFDLPASLIEKINKQSVRFNTYMTHEGWGTLQRPKDLLGNLEHYLDKADIHSPQKRERQFSFAISASSSDDSAQGAGVNLEESGIIRSDLTGEEMKKISGQQLQVMLSTAKNEIEGYLTKQHNAGNITDEIYKKAMAVAYKNLEFWVTDAKIKEMSPNTSAAILTAIAQKRWKDIVEVFRQDITFGTAGIRGMAALTKAELQTLKDQGPSAMILKGPNTINDVVLLLKTAGVIKYAKEQSLHKVAIGYDSRIAGKEFAEMIAKFFIGKSTKEYPFTVYLFDAASPFPELSFGVTTKAVRADLGILISASHNPSNYNGYKITDFTGAQLTGKMRDDIVAAIAGVTTNDIELAPLESAKPGKLIWLGGAKPIEGKDYKGVDLAKYFIDMHTLHVDQVKRFIIDAKTVKQFAPQVKVGYAAFNGSGNVATPRLLSELGFTDTKVINSLQELDGMFPAFGWGEQPDPGDPISADIAVREFIKEYGQKAFDDLDALIGTDPDADRAGIIVKVPESQQNLFGKYKLLSANDAWTLLLWYRLQREKDLNNGTLPAADKKYVTFSHVTTDAIEKVGELFGVKSLGDMLSKKGEPAGDYLNGRRSWVGFSYIAEYARKARENGMINVGGAEESNGFSILGGVVKEGNVLGEKGHVNDKDGTFAALLLMEVAAYAKSQGTSLFELLDNIYLDPVVGYYATANKPMPRVGSFAGAEGVTKKINLLKTAQDWMKEANARANTSSPFILCGLPVIGAVEFKSGRYDAQHYDGFPDEGIRLFFADAGLKNGEPFTKSRNFITIRPSGTSQTIRFYTQLFAAGLNKENLGALKYEASRRAEAISLQAQVELLEATSTEKVDYKGDIPNITEQMKSAKYDPRTIVRLITGADFVEKKGGTVVAQKLHTVLYSRGNADIRKRFLQGGYQQAGYGIEEGAVIDGSFAIGNEGNQGYYVNGGKEIFLNTIASMRKFFERRAEILGKPIKYVIKPGIGGQHTPFQGIADTFEVIDLKTGKVVGEYELGKNYEEALGQVLKTLDADWDQIAVIPSSKSGSTDETMMIFTEIFYTLLKNIAAKEGINGELFAKTVLDTMHEVNFINGVERPGEDLFKGFSVDLVYKNLSKIRAMKNIAHDQVNEIFEIVLGNMFFETTDRPEASRLSAFIRNSGLDKELGINAPGFGAMFDNVGGRWTADLHMMTFLAYHKLSAEEYWNTRYEGIKKVREGKHPANEIAGRILDEGIIDMALVVPDELLWFGKAIEQNFNESIWQKGFANIVAVKQSMWEAQKNRYTGKRDRLVINISSIDIPGAEFNLVRLPSFETKNMNKQALANGLGELFTTFYGITNTVGNRLIARALSEKGLKGEDIDVGNLDNPATKILQENLYLRQPFVELGKGLLEKKLKALQEEEAKNAGAIDRELKRIMDSGKGKYTESNIPGIKTTGDMYASIAGAIKFADNTGRKLAPFIYVEGDKFYNLRDYLVGLGIEWVMQGTGDQHISYQQVLAQPQKYLPFIISFVPASTESTTKGLPAIGFAKGYLNNVSPNLVRDSFAEASYKALTELRKDAGGLGVFMRLSDNEDNRETLAEAFSEAVRLTEEAASEVVEVSMTGPIEDIKAPTTPSGIPAVEDETVNTENGAVRYINEKLSETEQAFAAAGVAKMVEEALTGAGLAKRLPIDAENSITIEAIGLSTTLRTIAAPETTKKIVLLGYDTGLDPASKAAAQAGEVAVNRYLNNTFVEVRSSGKLLLEGMRSAFTKLKSEYPDVKEEDIVVMTITGQATLAQINKTDLKDLGKILDIMNMVDASGKIRPIPVIGLYDLVLRIAYGQDIERDILPCLNRVASNGNGQPFTKNDIEQLLSSGLLRLIPRAQPVNMTEAAEAYRAARAVAQAL